MGQTPRLSPVLHDVTNSTGKRSGTGPATVKLDVSCPLTTMGHTARLSPVHDVTNSTDKWLGTDLATVKLDVSCPLNDAESRLSSSRHVTIRPPSVSVDELLYRETATEVLARLRAEHRKQTDDRERDLLARNEIDDVVWVVRRGSDQSTTNIVPVPRHKHVATATLSEVEPHWMQQTNAGVASYAREQVASQAISRRLDNQSSEMTTLRDMLPLRRRAAFQRQPDWGAGAEVPSQAPAKDGHYPLNRCKMTR